MNKTSARWMEWELIRKNFVLFLFSPISPSIWHLIKRNIFRNSIFFCDEIETISLADSVVSPHKWIYFSLSFDIFSRSKIQFPYLWRNYVFPIVCYFDDFSYPNYNTLFTEWNCSLASHTYNVRQANTHWGIHLLVSWNISTRIRR